MSRALLALENFLALSEAMAKAADEQAWDALARLGDERSVLGKDLPDDLTKAIPLAEFEPVRSILERCRQLDAHTRALIDERQKDLRVLLREPAAPPTLT